MRGRQVTFRWLPQSRYALPLQILMMALLVGSVWATHMVAPQDRNWVGYTYILAFPAWMMAWTGPRLRFLADGALVTVMPVGVPQYIPLGTAELTCQGAWWQLRWQRGRTWSRTRLKADPALPLEAAIAAAKNHAAEGLPIPRTEQEAARAVPVGRLPGPKETSYIASVGAVLLILLGLAVWLNQPLVLLPVLLLPVFLHRVQQPSCAVLTRSGLWITAPGGVPARIDPATVAYVTEVSRGIAVFRTGHPEYPELRLNIFQNGDLVRNLRFGPAPAALDRPAAAAGQTAAAPGPATACALCGRPAPGPAPAPGETYICQECTLRTRQEALDAGHGPQGREPRPM